MYRRPRTDIFKDTWSAKGRFELRLPSRDSVDRDRQAESHRGTVDKGTMFLIIQEPVPPAVEESHIGLDSLGRGFEPPRAH